MNTKTLAVILVGAFFVLLHAGCSTTRSFKTDGDAIEEILDDEQEDVIEDQTDDPIPDTTEEITEDVIVGDVEAEEDVGEDVWGDVEEEDEVPLHNCNNGIVEIPYEDCDDMNTDDCDGCSNECKFENAMNLVATADNIGAGKNAGGVETGDTEGPCLAGDATIEFWFKPTSPYGEQTIIEQRWGYRVLVAPNGATRSSVIWHFNFTPYNNTVKSVDVPGDFVVGNWYHVAVVREHVAGNEWRVDVWVDGVNIDTETVRNTFGTWSCQGWFSLGGAIYSTSTFPGRTRAFIGEMDEVRLTNAVLYTAPFAPESRLSPTSDTAAYWDFNEIVGGYYLDISSHGFDMPVIDGAVVADECHL